MSTSNDLSLAKAINRLADVHDKQLGEIAEALHSISTQIKYLGNGNAATQMGALEVLGLAIKESSESIASAINDASAKE